jgi:hypothetical protein
MVLKNKQVIISLFYYDGSFNSYKSVPSICTVFNFNIQDNSQIPNNVFCIILPNASLTTNHSLPSENI